MVQQWSKDSSSRRPTFLSTSYNTDGPQHQTVSGKSVGGSLPRQTLTERSLVGAAGDSQFRSVDDMPRRPRPVKDEFTRTFSGANWRRYFAAVIGDDGSPKVFFSAGQKLNDEVIRQFFDLTKFHQVMNRLEAGVNPMLDHYSPTETYNNFEAFETSYSNSTSSARRHSSAVDCRETPSRRAHKIKKRRRPTPTEYDVPPVLRERQGILVGDSEELWKFYTKRFHDIQQHACKEVAKAWIKEVEPKKQSTHPYTGSIRPEWWPVESERIRPMRHKEPDHLSKTERIYLLTHIVRLVMEPSEKQQADVQKSGLNIKRLRDLANDALAKFFSQSEENEQKREFLNELFRVALLEERYKNGGSDASTIIGFKDDSKGSGMDDDEDESILNDDDQADLKSTQVSMGNLQGVEPGVATHMHSNSVMSEMPLQSSQYPPLMMRDIPPQQHAYVETNGLPTHGRAPMNTTSNHAGIDVVTSPHNPSRRQSVFSDYQSPGSSNMSAQPWAALTVDQTNSPMHVYTHQQTPSFVSPNVSMSTTQSFIPGGGSFEGTSGPGYGPNHGVMFRTEELGNTGVSPHQGYSFAPQDGRHLPAHTVDGLP